VNCCNPEDRSNGGWGIFNAILGWQNSATVGSVVSYCVYWIFVTLALIIMRIDERRVARGDDTLFRTILQKCGVRSTKESLETVAEVEDYERDDSVRKGPQTGIERDVREFIA
jgi:hypothetical protein